MRFEKLVPLFCKVASVLAVIVIVICVIPRFAEGDEPSIEALRTTEFLERQLTEAEAMISLRSEELSSVDDDGRRDDIEDEIEILEYAQGILKSAQGGADSAGVFSSNSVGYRILESIRVPVEGSHLPAFNVAFRNVVWGGIFGHGIPAVSAEDVQLPVGEAQARKESPYLFDTESGGFVSVERLAKLSHNEISRLDVSPGHPAWYTESEWISRRGSSVSEFHRMLEAGVEDLLRRKEDLAPGHNYRLDDARKVLFLKEVYLSATSPKANTEDAFGVDWKIKWGDETAVEPVSSRLYLLAGGRVTDLTFANGVGRDSVVLILNGKGATEKYEEKDDERAAETYVELTEALKDFYGFDISNFVHGHGVITSENVSSVLSHLPDGGKKEFQREKLIGREWVTFKEALVELKPKGFMKRYEGSKMSDVVAKADRACRGSYLFDLWIANRDVKDDNNRTYYRRGTRSNGERGVVQYNEGHHDLGLTLGSLFAAGEINLLRTGSRFAGFREGGKKIRFHQSMIFKPDSWKAATWADSMWMARKICGLRKEEISEAVSASNWPDFAQQALLYKILDRRNTIGVLFGLESSLDHHPVKSPDMTVSLANSAEIASAEARYQLPEGVLAAELASMNPGPGYKDVVLKGGQISSCEESVLVKLLVRHRFPSGIAKRYRRQSDTIPGCEN